MKMDPGYLTLKDFNESDIHYNSETIHWKRSTTEGGKNFGHDFKVPSGSVVIAYKIETISEICLKGNRHTYLITEQRGPLNIPVGIHNGHRLHPESWPGSGASYKFEIKLAYVSEALWYKKTIENLSNAPKLK